MNEKKPVNKIDKFWGVTQSGSSFKIEIFAGIATFLAMAYILTVNPNQLLWTGVTDPKWASIFIATALGAITGTLLMAFLAKMPFAQASGMGLNATVGGIFGGGLSLFGVYAYTYGFEFTFGNAMMLVLISGLIFLFLSIVPVGKDKVTGKFITLREKIFDGMPKAVRTAIPVGIGLFIAFIGMQNAGIITANPFVLVQFVNFTKWSEVGSTAASATVCIFGLIVIAVLSQFKVKGAVIIGILAATLLAIPLGVADLTVLTGTTPGISWKFWESFKNFFSFNSSEGGVFFAAFTEGTVFPAGSVLTCVMIVITLAMIDMFDTMGTVVGCAANAGLVDEDGKPLNYNKIMYADSIATCTGALYGTSTVTTFVESGAGVAVGGKTGMTAFVTAVLFLLAIFLLPIFAFIPSAAAASALIWVGVLMLSGVKNVDLSSPTHAVPAFLTIIMMPLCYSITDGIGIGIISYVILAAFGYLINLAKYGLKKGDKPVWEISVVALVITALFLVYFLVPKIL
ncbi:MAG TPA: NCS2 family permease [Bacilli bacterium]|nr:NCS2 family permease [Bacilli bacterium]